MNKYIKCPDCGDNGKWCLTCKGHGRVLDQRDVRRGKLIKFAEMTLDYLDGKTVLEIEDIIHDLQVIAVQMRLGTEDADGKFRRDES